MQATNIHTRFFGSLAYYGGGALAIMFLLFTRTFSICIKLIAVFAVLGAFLSAMDHFEKFVATELPIYSVIILAGFAANTVISFTNRALRKFNIPADDCWPRMK